MTEDGDDDWDMETALDLALSTLPDREPEEDDEEGVDGTLIDADEMLRAALGGQERIEQLSEADRACYHSSAANAVNALVVAYGNSIEGPHRVVFAGTSTNWRSACDTAMSRIREKVRRSCHKDGIEVPALPSLYMRDFKELSPTYGEVYMTMTTVKPDTGRELVEVFQRRIGIGRG